MLRACIDDATLLLPSLDTSISHRLQANLHRWEGVRCAIIGDQQFALAAYTVIDDDTGITRSMGNIGKLYSDVGDTAQALQWYHRAGEIDVKGKGFMKTYWIDTRDVFA
ncbi:hypothetical protein BH10BAC6_BH10BAC6_05910 [soil metagenome]